MAAYPLLPIVLLVVAAYGITRLFARWHIIALQTHRKVWNWLLLTTFLVSGGLGLFSVVKINYQLDVPGYDRLLSWHVSFGIAMALISLIHLFHHLKYYFSPRTPARPTEIPPPEESDPSERKRIAGFLLLLGGVSIINQVVFIREFMSVLEGNEMVLGLVMAAWFLLTGWGAWHGRKTTGGSSDRAKVLKALIFIAFFPVLSIVLLYGLKRMLFPPGIVAGLDASTTGILLLLFPVCFLSGYLFTLLSTLLSREKNRIGTAYAYESIGSLMGGLLFAFLLGRFFTSIQVFSLTTGIVLLAGGWIIPGAGKRKVIVYSLAGLLIPVLVFFLHPDRRIKRWFFPNQEILENQSTRYGNLVVTRQAGQLNFYENNSLQFYTENRTDSEEAVHFPMALHENPKQVLLLSGGISGMLAEIEKYPVEKITYLENNPETYRLWKERTHSEGSRVSFVKADIRTFLKRDHTRYDVILIHLPPPSSLGINRFYTREFFQLIKEHCREGSIVCTSLPSTLNYPGQQALDARASLWKTLGLQFSYQRLLPGGRDYFLASDRPLPSGITSLLAEKGIETAYVHAGYIDDELMERRGKEQTAQFDPKVRVNSDAHPYLFSKAISHWFDFMDAGYIAWILLPVVLFLFLMLRMKPVTLGVYVGGFTAASLEVALMFAWQVFFGGLYGASALFFALFMGGLALGSHSTWSRGGEVRMKHFSLIQYSLAALSLLLPFFLNFIGKMGGFSTGAQVMLMIPVFLLSYAIGLEFQLASRLRNLSFSEISGIHYSADLIGSAFGAYLCALFLLPVLGLFCTALALTVLNVFSGTLALFVRRG